MIRAPVDDYVATLPASRRERIGALYAAVSQQVPEAVGATTYAMPCLALRGQGLPAGMSTVRHIGLYPFSGMTVAAHAQALHAHGITTTKGAIRLPDEVPLPPDLLIAIVATRLAEIR